MHYRIISDCLITPHEVLDQATLEIDGAHLLRVDDRIQEHRDGLTLDMRGHVVVPAFINAHDHFLGTWLPRVGRGNYLNWAEWNVDLKNSDVMIERSRTTDLDRYILAAYKSLCAGVTTVSDHIPHEINEPFIDQVPVRILTNYALAHAISDLRLDWGDGIVPEFTRSNGTTPFITHANEGFDPDTRDEIHELHRLGALQRNTVLIHGIALSDDDIELVARQQASLIWCPVSNMFMFNVTANIPEMLRVGANVALGTDSCATGALHLMGEMAAAKKISQEWSFGAISDRDFLNMVTINAARAFLIDDKLGSLEAGKLADVLVLKRHYDDAYASATSCQPEDIQLLTMAGQPMIGSTEYQTLFDQADQVYSWVPYQDGDRLICGDPMGVVERIREAVGSPKSLDFLPFG